MMLSSKYVLVAATVVVLLSYYFHAPLPQGISDRWNLKLIIAGYRLANLLARVGSGIGYDSSINMTRALFGTVFSLTSQPTSAEDMLIHDSTIDGVAVRMFRPTYATPGEELPVIIYYHGGAFFVFSTGTYENVLRQLTKETRALVIAVEYRLAPEHPYPIPMDDCYKVTLHVLGNTADYGGDRNRVALAGDSAGGNLAAAVAWRLAFDTPPDLNLPSPKLQVLLYPMLQAFDFQLPSYVDLNGLTDQIVNSEAFAAAWFFYCTGKLDVDVPGILANNHTNNKQKRSKFAHYVDIKLIDKSKNSHVSEKFDEKLVASFENCITDPRYSPLMAPDFSKFPQTYILSAEFDILRDECFMFETRLNNSSVPVHHDHILGGWHGMASYTRTQGGRNALKRVVDYIKTNL